MRKYIAVGMCAIMLALGMATLDATDANASTVDDLTVTCRENYYQIYTSRGYAHDAFLAWVAPAHTFGQRWLGSPCASPLLGNVPADMAAAVKVERFVYGGGWTLCDFDYSFTPYPGDFVQATSSSAGLGGVCGAWYWPAGATRVTSSHSMWLFGTEHKFGFVFTH